MNLKTLSDDQLLTRTEALVGEERELLTKILHHLREIESRRLFSKLKYKSLFDYAVKHLKYSADQAARRISAMRILKDMPELEEKIEAGALTLTNLSLAHTLFRKEELSKSEKSQFLKKIENLSSRDAERLAFAHSSEPLKLNSERIRPVSDNHIEIKFVADSALAEKLERVKGLLAHKKSGENLADLVNTLCDMAIEKLVPSATSNFAQKAKRKSNSPMISQKTGAPRGQCVTKSIPVGVKRFVWKKAENRCENCSSTFALEIDHVWPKAMGGPNDPENLRLLCRSCNQRAAIENLGLGKMQKYLDSKK